MGNKIIPIFFSFDNNYVEPAAVAFYSLLNKAKSDIFYDMYVLHHNITEEKQNLLQDIVHRFKNARLTFKNTEGFMQNEWNNGNFEGHNTQTQFTSDTVIRCFAASFFPQFDKIIYSDVDIIVVDDISEIYDIDLDGKYIAAVKNFFMKYDTHELSHLKPEHYEMLKDTYFAGGIWVLNLQQIRKDNLEAKMIEIIKDDTIVKRWNDQDIMNIACANKVSYLPLNYISYPYLLGYLTCADFQSHYSREELYDSIINPKIIHFAAFKPWNDNPKYSELWWTFFNYLNLEKTTIFKDPILENKQNTDDLVKKLRKQTKKHKKYRIYFNITLAVTICLLIALLLQLFY